MKRVLVMCGAGLATSTMIYNRIKSFCEENELQVELVQTRANEVISGLNANEFDFVISTTIAPAYITVPVIDGISFITGIGEDEVLEEIKKMLIGGN